MNINFPFDYDLVDIPDTERDKTNDTSGGFNKPDQPLYDESNNRGGYHIKNERLVKETLNIIKIQIESDLKSYEKNLEFLIEKKDQLEIRENQVKKEADKLSHQNLKLQSEIKNLREQYDVYN